MPQNEKESRDQLLCELRMLIVFLPVQQEHDAVTHLFPLLGDFQDGAQAMFCIPNLLRGVLQILADREKLLIDEWKLLELCELVRRFHGRKCVACVSERMSEGMIVVHPRILSPHSHCHCPFICGEVEVVKHGRGALSY